MLAPSRVGRYEIVRRLGKSMTDVYLAMDTVENRPTALKLVKSAPDAMTQLVLEAERRGAVLQMELRTLDPRMVEIYEFGDADGYFFVAMQYVEGRSLAEVLSGERRLEPERAARIALDVCVQLEKLHNWQSNLDGPRSAVVHGDIKPSNVHLGPNGTVRLLDFGIAKALRADRDATLHNFGSPGYCPPERLARLQVNQQSDLWALGATLYEMLAGAPPYQAADTQKLERLIQARRPPRALPAICPRPLRAIVSKALAPDPERRYGAAGDFRTDLEAFLDGRPTTAESERQAGWSSSQTIEAAREYLAKATRTLRREALSRQAAGAVFWFLVGIALWIGGTYAWQGLSKRRQVAPPPPDTTAILRSEYLLNANRVIDSYRTSSDPSLRNFDWRLAEFSLTRLVELGARDSEVLGKLALCKGYGLLLPLMGTRVSDRDALRVRLASLDQFIQASVRLPQAPDPHLALARIYVYSLPDLEKGLAEFRTAEALGYRLQPREIEQQADAFRRRAERESAAGSRQEARVDAGRARGLYAQIRGYDLADQHLISLGRLMAAAPPRHRRRGLRLWP